MNAAFGIGHDGSKMILSIRQGATENATVVGELLGDLMSRGLDFTEPRLYVLDGGKALHAAVKKYVGESAPIQRCQVHKRRNVTDEDKPIVAQKLNAAYALEDYAAAKESLDDCITNSCISIRAPRARNGRNLERSPAACSPATAAYLGQHQRH